MNNDAVIIICTRPDSKRLPNKAFLPVADIPAIEHILNRLIDCQIPVILAVPVDCKDYGYLIEKYNGSLNLDIIPGDPESPLHRMRYAFDTYQKYFKEAKWIIRITHDDILIDQKTMIDLLDECRKRHAGYGITPSIIDGAGVEVIHCDNLRYGADAHRQPTEYISYFVKYEPKKRIVSMEPRFQIKRDYRMTMDYQNSWTHCASGKTIAARPNVPRGTFLLFGCKDPTNPNGAGHR